MWQICFSSLSSALAGTYEILSAQRQEQGGAEGQCVFKPHANVGTVTSLVGRGPTLITIHCALIPYLC